MKAAILGGADAQAYAEAAGITNSEAGECIGGFFQVLRDEGLADKMVDFASLRLDQNVVGGTNLISFQGRSGFTWGGAVKAPGGVEIGTPYGGVIWTNITDCSTGLTMMVAMTGVSGGQTNHNQVCPWMLQANMGGSNFALGYFASGAPYTAYCSSNWIYGVVTSGSAINESTYASFWYTNQWKPSVVGLAYDRRGVITNFMDGYIVSGNSGHPPLGSLTKLSLGHYLFDGFTPSYGWRGSVQAWAMFRGILTSNETMTVERAFRWLNPNRNNLVVVGDSTSYINNSKPAEGWFYQYYNSKGGTNKGHPYVYAASGRTIETMTNIWSMTAALRAPNGGSVKSADLYCLAGENNLYLLNDEASSLWNKYANLLELGKSAGYTVHAFQLAPNYGFSVTNMTNLTRMWNLVSTNRASYDAVYHLGRLCPNTNDSAIFLDNLHFTTNGYGRIASDIVAGGAISAGGMYGSVGTLPLGTYFQSNAVQVIPSAAALGPGGYWIGVSNNSLVAIYTANGSTTAMKVLAP